MIRIAAFLLALLVGASAHAQVFGPAVFTPTATSGGGFVGPGDVVSGVAHFYGVEGVSAAYAAPGTNPAFDYSCTGGSPATGTINILSTGYADAATLSAACGANTIIVTKIYDQVGTVHIDTTLAGNVTIVLNCSGSHPCFVSGNGGTNCMKSSSTFSISLPYTIAGSYGFASTPLANSRELALGSSGALVGANTSSEMIGYNGTILAASSASSANTFYAVAVAFDSTGIIGVNGATNSGVVGTASATNVPVLLSTASTSGCSTALSAITLDIGIWAASWSAGNMAAVSAQERSNFGF